MQIFRGERLIFNLAVIGLIVFELRKQIVSHPGVLLALVFVA